MVGPPTRRKNDRVTDLADTLLALRHRVAGLRLGLATPGAEVAIGRYIPRNCGGASGLRS